MINEKQNAVLLAAGFTQREINTQKRKFYNLFYIEPWLEPMRKHGEWEGLTMEDKKRILDSDFGGSRADCMVEAEKILKEKNT